MCAAYFFLRGKPPFRKICMGKIQGIWLDVLNPPSQGGFSLCSRSSLSSLWLERSHMAVSPSLSALSTKLGAPILNVDLATAIKHLYKTEYKKKKKTFINEQNHPEKSIHLCTSPIFSESQVSIGLEESLPDCLTKRHSTSAWNKLTLEQDLAFRSTTLDSSVCLPNHQALPEKKKTTC